MDLDFWREKKVLITGHTGFKGSWLSLWLSLLKADVTGLALLPPSTPSLFDSAGIERRVTSNIGDIRDLNVVKEVVDQCDPDIVFHLAAQPLVRESYIDPVGTYATNVMGTVNILESIRPLKRAKVLVNVTSDKCYENKEWVWSYRENDSLGGYDPYSSSKACSEILTASYRNSFFNPKNYNEHGKTICTARAGNVIGGGDWGKDRLVPDIFKSFSSGKVVEIRNPGAIRPWQFVLEPLHGYLLLAEHCYKYGPGFGGSWNFGPDIKDIKPVSYLVEHLASLWGEEATWEKDSNPQPHEASLLRLDCTKSTTMLGWRPKMNIGHALLWSVEWMQQYLSGKNADLISVSQIKKYMELDA
jgi:CDP-glucose 4,6-dehydratase